MHISGIEDKSARNLAQAEMPDDPHHNDIKQAARILVEEGSGEFVYTGSDSAVIFKFPIRGGAIRTFAPNAWSKYQRHLEVSSEYDVNPDPGPPSVFDGFGENELNPIEMDNIRRQRRWDEMTEDERLRHGEQECERASGYRSFNNMEG